jgi:hypothetical protein
MCLPKSLDPLIVLLVEIESCETVSHASIV